MGGDVSGCVAAVWAGIKVASVLLIHLDSLGMLTERILCHGGLSPLHCGP